MCGIAGIWADRTRAVPDRSALERMIGVLRHRGPDGFGYYTDAGVGLAHARLSIIDLATGEQPIHNEDKSVWVVFNGEIFNYVELRRDLIARGHRFYTNSDTEVIVHLYEEQGDSFVDELNGQFAIAIWDARNRKLILARDRAGIRPLFYAWSGERLLFASEAKGLFAEGSIEPRLDLQSLGQVFTYWAPLEGRSAFKGVESVPPGHIMTVTARGVAVRRYWDWNFSGAESAATRSRESYAEELLGLLSDAVRLQLRADVPVGTYLSGGLDSSAVTALVHEINRAPVRAFSLSFQDSEFDESDYQREVTDRLGVVQTTVQVTKEAIAAGFRRAVWHAEVPIVRTAPIPLMLLAAAVHDARYKVVLTGEGADEIFAGYDLFREAKIRRWIAKHPRSEWRPRLLERLYPYLRNSPVQGQAFSRHFFGQGTEHRHRAGYSHLPRWSTTRRSWQFFSADARRALGEVDPLDEIAAMLPADTTGWSDLGVDQYIEAHTLMTGYLLASQGDRVAMAHSVEGRFPYLDHRLMEFAARLPPQVKLFGLHEKHVLKQAVRNLVPDRIVRRPKQPYRAPDSQSFVINGRLREDAAELLSSRALRDAGYFDVSAVARLVDKCQAGRAIGFSDNMAFIGILSTMALHEAFIVGRKSIRTPVSLSA
jgi:asparagine synthase (glutamine-hydrolysing)